MRAAGHILTSLLVLLAVALVSWFVYAGITDATLVVFRTGSMSPTIPQGAVAVTQPIPAAEVEVGDIVTVRRQDAKLPVTHRVIEVRPAPDSAPKDARELQLKGDANTHVDAFPDVVRDVRKTVMSVPNLGKYLMFLQTPPIMVFLLIGLGALTTWAFWPKGPARKPEGPT